MQTGGVNAKVTRLGAFRYTRMDCASGARLPPLAGQRYMTLTAFRTGGVGVRDCLDQGRTRRCRGTSRGARQSEKFVESDTALVNRILGREVGGKQNILVMNDEATMPTGSTDRQKTTNSSLTTSTRTKKRQRNSSKRRRSGSTGSTGSRSFGESTSASIYPRRRTSLAGRAGPNQPFLWVVSDFGLIDAIESGLVKIPQLAVRTRTGADDARVLQYLAMDVAADDRRRNGAASGQP